MSDIKVKPPGDNVAGLDTDAMDAVEALLTTYIHHAQTSAAVAAAAAKVPGAAEFQGKQAAYWNNVASGLKWVRGQFKRSRTAHERRNAPAGADGQKRPR